MKRSGRKIQNTCSKRYAQVWGPLLKVEHRKKNETTPEQTRAAKGSAPKGRHLRQNFQGPKKKENLRPPLKQESERIPLSLPHHWRKKLERSLSSSDGLDGGKGCRGWGGLVFRRELLNRKSPKGEP